MMAQPERRRAPRVTERVPLAITNGGVALATETQNLSATGAYCTVHRFIPPMTKLKVELELPLGAQTARVACVGVVVRIEPAVHSVERASYEMAIYFTELSARDRATIERFVRQRLGTPSA